MHIDDIIWLPQVIDKQARNRDNMGKEEPRPEFKSYEEVAEFWDTHSLAEYWHQTEPAEFDISEQARRRYVIRINQKPCRQEQHVAPRGDGITPDVQGNEM